MKTALLLLSLCVCTATVLAADAPPPPRCWYPLLNATFRAAAGDDPASIVAISASESVSLYNSLSVNVVGGGISLGYFADLNLRNQLLAKVLLVPKINQDFFTQATPVLLQCAAGTLNRTQQQIQNGLNQLSDCAQLVVASFGRNVESRGEMRDLLAFVERVLSEGGPPNFSKIADYFIRLFGNVNFNDTGSIIRLDANAALHFGQRLRLCDVLMKPSVPPQFSDCLRRVIDASRVLVATNRTMEGVLGQARAAFDADVELRQQSGRSFDIRASIRASLNVTFPNLSQAWIDQTLQCIQDAEQPVQQPPAQTGIPGGAEHPDDDPICEINCPNNLICVGYLCVPPRPKCDGCDSSASSGSDRYCLVNVNATLLANFNTYAYAATRARRSGSIAQRPLDTELGFTYGIDITARGEYRGICVSKTPPPPQCANITNPVSCAPGDICTREGCRRCDLCAGNGRPGDNATRIPADISDQLIRGGFDLSGFVRVDVRVNNTREGGEVEAVQGGFQQIGSDVRNLARLFFQAAQGAANSSQQTAIQLSRGTQLLIQQIIQTIPAAPVTIVVDRNASFNATRVELRQDTTFAILLSGRDSEGRCNGNASLNGALTIQGSSDGDSDNTTVNANGQLQTGGSWNFPPRRQDVIAGPNAVINVAGAVALAGDISNATLNVIAIATARAVCVVANGARFATAGHVLGSDGSIYVRGALVIQTTLVQPELRIEAGGNVTLDAGDTRTGFLGGALNISANGQLNLRSNGTATNFTKFVECAAQATLVIHVDSITAVRRPGARGILFRFTSIGTLGIKFACRIRLIDTQNITLELINPNQAQATRRLLADGETQAVFSNNDVSFVTAESSPTTTTTTVPPTSAGTTTTSPPTTTTNTNTTILPGSTTTPPTTSTPTSNPSSSSSTAGGRQPNTAYTTTTTTTINAAQITFVAAITAVIMAAF